MGVGPAVVAPLAVPVVFPAVVLEKVIFLVITGGGAGDLPGDYWWWCWCAREVEGAVCWGRVFGVRGSSAACVLRLSSAAPGGGGGGGRRG